MKFIATDVADSKKKMLDMIAVQLQKPGFAMDRYFYRSHFTYQAELESVIFKSWLYAGHVSQVRHSGDFFLFEISILVNGSFENYKASLCFSCILRSIAVFK